MRSEINSWKPEVENRIHELEHAVADLGERMDRALGVLLPTAGAALEVLAGVVTIATAPTAHREDIPLSPSAKVPDSAHLESSPHGAASGSLDHGKGSPHRGAAFGAVYTVAPETAPVTGATQLPKSFPSSFPKDDSVFCDRRGYPCYQAYPPPTNPFPDLEFHKFEGSNPKLWVKRCETYFDVYQIDPGKWVKLATMRLTGSAALWCQTMQTTISSLSWDFFVTAMCNRFDRDEHNHLLRHFFHVNQTTFVSEFVEHFSDLVHQILAHNPSFPPSVITNHFLDGLKKDIRAAVVMHQPQDLDTATSLAFLQEEALQDQPAQRTESGHYFKKSSPDSMKSGYTSTPSPTRSTDEKTVDSTKPKVVPDDKLSALKNYRRSKGLCFKCGEKWSPQHKCPATVSLQAMEQLWQCISEDGDFCIPDADTDLEEDLMAIFIQALNGVEGFKTLRLRGHLQGKEVFMLVDSGSSHSFVSSTMASTIQPCRY
jgi:hypothetical protein